MAKYKLNSIMAVGELPPVDEEPPVEEKPGDGTEEKTAGGRKACGTDPDSGADEKRL